MKAQTATATKERPILFSGPMVQAILDGRKTQTRRAVNLTKLGWNTEQPDCGSTWCRNTEVGWEWWGPVGDDGRALLYQHSVPCPYGKSGDRLWVRESHSVRPCNCCVRYKADENLLDAGEQWKPSIFMERRFSRITLEITNVRVERLHEISEQEAEAEGVTHDMEVYPTLRGVFARVWEKINGKKHPWESNPWVWVIEFKKV